MLETLRAHIQRERLFEAGDKLLLAVSGGVDSMLMLRLFSELGYGLGVAHCNFQLRGEESDADMRFVEDTCSGMGVRCHSKIFDAAAYASERKCPIQVAARELRYAWFERIMETGAYKYLVTAHHQNDHVETVLINLVRGTGINGLLGIREKSGKIRRPLLIFTREEIESHARKIQLAFRNDSSNAGDDYTRNKIRHHVVPVLKEINPSLEKNMRDFSQRMQEV